MTTTLTALSGAALAACVQGGNFDLQGGCIGIWDSSISQVFDLFTGTSPNGDVKLEYDAGLGQINFYIRGSLFLSTALLGTNPLAPAFQNIRPGDELEFRAWYLAGLLGTFSAGIRFAVNGVFGYDTIGTAVGPGLSALTTMSTQQSTSYTARTQLTGTTQINPYAEGALLGDSIVAPRGNLPSLASIVARSLSSKPPILSIAKGGATILDQLTAWQNTLFNRSRTEALWTVMQCGINDIGNGRTPQQILTDYQTYSNEIEAMCPFGVINILSKILPARVYLNGISSTLYPIWDVVNTLTKRNDGTLACVDVATLLTGFTDLVSAHVDELRNGEFDLQTFLSEFETAYTFTPSDGLHPNYLSPIGTTGGREINAAAIVATLHANGIA